MATVRRSEASSTARTKSRPAPELEEESSFLASARTDFSNENRGFGLVVYGPEGVGKTSFACHAESPIVIPDQQDFGPITLKTHNSLPPTVAIGRPPLPSVRGELEDDDIDPWDDALNILDELASSQHPYKTVIIDYLGSWQQRAFEKCCREEFPIPNQPGVPDWSDKGFLAYGKGPITTAKLYWPELLRRLTTLQEMEINVILVTHSRVETFKNPAGPDYDRFSTDLAEPPKGESIRKNTYRWADAVIFIDNDVSTSVDDPSDTRKKQKLKASGGDARLLYLEGGGAFDAKNRYGINKAFLGPFNNAKSAWNGFMEEAFPHLVVKPATKPTTKTRR